LQEVPVVQSLSTGEVSTLQLAQSVPNHRSQATKTSILAVANGRNSVTTVTTDRLLGGGGDSTPLAADAGTN